jgi:ATP-dependent RNA helicase SUPV3L1/SUV3
MKQRGKGFSLKRFPKRSRKRFQHNRHSERLVPPKTVVHARNSAYSQKSVRAFSAAHKYDRFRDYKEYFTLARSLGRKLKFLAGPTNSGKTFRALNDLSISSSGLYLAPLRLLALEGQEELEKRGVIASFVTGEEQDLHEGARFVASTIEMANLQEPVECAVVDEVQLLVDPSRGWAWAQALIGVPASQVIMTGSADAIPLVQAMADYLEEPLKIETVDRYTPLELLDAPAALETVDHGTAVIAFSRRDVLNIKQFLQKERKLKVSVIYGNLSPQVRREEARRFRSGESDIVVATDAIGMGLNLPIRQVLFFVTQKFNGEQMVPLAEAEIRQIAGRAGRFGIHDEGFTGALDSWEDHRRIGAALRDHPRPLEGPVGIMPSATYLEALARAMNTRKLEVVLKEFQKNMVFDSQLLVPGVTDDMIQLAAWTDQFPLDLDTRYLLTCAPVDPGERQVMDYWLSYLRAIAKDTPARALVPESVFNLDPSDSNNLFQAELLVKCMTLYAWLAYRDAVLFPEIDRCNELRGRLNWYIESGLKQKGLKVRCKYCQRTLPAFHEYGICERCFKTRRHRR